MASQKYIYPEYKVEAHPGLSVVVTHHLSYQIYLY